MRKSFFICLSDRSVAHLYSMPIKGQLVILNGNWLNEKLMVAGWVEEIMPDNHGTLLYLCNMYTGTHLNWKLIPLFISECGQSGILAPWKDKEVGKYLQEYDAKLEREATNCLAL